MIGFVQKSEKSRKYKCVSSILSALMLFCNLDVNQRNYGC